MHPRWPVVKKKHEAIVISNYRLGIEYVNVIMRNAKHI